ncbi:MAG: hypothetical protein KF726_09410 [Anaerolineae bacterium]|nr:hypothetical protein [Anaerolineae bacterium]
MGSGRRGVRLWLGLIGVGVALVVLGAIFNPVAVSPLLAVTVGVAYTLIAWMALANLRPMELGRQVNQLRNIGPTLTVAGRVSANGRRAAQRARNRGDFAVDTTLLDIGMVVNERRRNGQLERRIAESVSLDDAAVQPYIKVHAAPGSAERLTLIEYTVYDQSGNVQFTHKQKFFLRDGDNFIPCEQQLPLRSNEDIGRAGTWDLHVTVDGVLAAVHGFNVRPTLDQRGQRLSADPAAARTTSAAPARMTIASPSEEDGPVSLEDLLRDQERQSASSAGSKE